MLPPAYLFGLAGAIVLTVGIPYAEELLRCLRAKRDGLSGKDTPLWIRERAVLEAAETR